MPEKHFYGIKKIIWNKKQCLRNTLHIREWANQFNLIFGNHMDLLIIDSIQNGHKSIFEPLRFKIFLGATPQTPPFYRSLRSLQDPPEKNPVSAPDETTRICVDPEGVKGGSRPPNLK